MQTNEWLLRVEAYESQLVGHYVPLMGAQSTRCESERVMGDLGECFL